MRLAFQAVRVVLGTGLAGQLLEEVVRQRARLAADAGAECLGAFAAHQAVRVFALGQEQEAHAPAVLQRRQAGFQRAPGRRTAGLVAVEAEQDVGHHAKQPLDVLLAGGGAEGRHRIAQALLRQCDHVHVAFHHHDLVKIAAVLAYLEQAVQLLALVEHRGFRRVEVLGLLVAQHAATEADHPAPAVADREHHPVAEAVVAPAVVGIFDQQAGFDHRALLQAVAAQMPEQVVPARRREAQAEVAGNLAGQATALEVLHRSLARRMALQRLAVVVGGVAQQGVQRRLDLRLRRLPAAIAVLVRDFQPGLARQLLDRLGKLQLVQIHQKADGIAARAAAEAVVELLVRAYREGGRLFLMEGAAGAVVLAGLLQLDARSHHLDDVGAVEQVVNETLGDQSGHGGIGCARWSGKDSEGRAGIAVLR